jgi:UDP-2,3-diacylglucosamine pyrophosphatase LpxH
MKNYCRNTDKEIWREIIEDYYSDSIHVTETNGVGINCHGHVIVAPIREWHKAGEIFLCVNPNLSDWRRKLGMWLLKANEPIKYTKI